MYIPDFITNPNHLKFNEKENMISDIREVPFHHYTTADETSGEPENLL